jgi:single-stranded DNA-binding protein
VEGRVLQERWEQEGQKRSKTAMTASLVIFCGPKAKAKAEEPAAVPAGTSEEAPETDEDVPF